MSVSYIYVYTNIAIYVFIYTDVYTFISLNTYVRSKTVVFLSVMGFRQFNVL